MVDELPNVMAGALSSLDLRSVEVLYQNMVVTS